MTKRSPERRPAGKGGTRAAPSGGARTDASGRARAVPLAQAHMGAPAWALWVTLSALTFARAALAFVPSMAIWGLNLVRFLPPVLGWGLWALSALALAPVVARRAVPWVVAAGNLARWRPALASLLAAVLAFALVWAFPDRVRYMGDFLLRQGDIEESVEPASVFPQALPLDVWLHYRLPLMITRAGVASPNTACRALGALEAVGLALVAVAFPRVLALEEGAAAAVMAVVFFGGYLGMFTGYSKAVVEVCLLAAVVGVTAVHAVRTGSPLLGAGGALALALGFHRSALALVPGAIVAWALWWRAHGEGGAWRRPATITALALPVAALVVVAPKVIKTLVTVDLAVHLAPAITRAEGGILRSAFGGTRSLDLLSLVLVLSPLAIVIPALLTSFGGAPPRRARELVLLASLALPFVISIPFIHATNGLYRDWDNFAAAGVLLSLVAAWLAGESLRAPPLAWLAVAVVAGVAGSSAQWLAHHADVDRGLTRMEAFMTEPPRRSGTDRATTWDFIATRNYQLDRYQRAANAWAHAIETAPSPRMLLQRALAETMAGHLDIARQIYRQMIVQNPDDLVAWRGLAALSERLGDWDEARRAALKLLQLYPNHPDAVGILTEYAKRHPEWNQATAPQKR